MDDMAATNRAKVFGIDSPVKRVRAFAAEALADIESRELPSGTYERALLHILTECDGELAAMEARIRDLTAERDSLTENVLGLGNSLHIAQETYEAALRTVEAERDAYRAGYEQAWSRPEPPATLKEN